jgi:hypothetical protein
MIRPRPAHITIGAGLAATALAVAAVLPAQAAASTGWRIVATRHFGAASDQNFLYAVAAPSASDAWAFGSSQPDGATPAGGPVAENWNGTKWQAAALPSGLSDTITAASAPSATDVWAVTDISGTVLHYDGTAWSVAKQFQEPTGLQDELTGVTAFSPTNVWVFGGPGAFPGFGTWHLQGTTWTQVTGTGGAIASASALSPTSIWAVAADANAPQDIIVHYNGTAWEQESSSALDNVQFAPSVVALSAANVWATGSVSNSSGTSSTPYLLHMSGTAWSRIKIPYALDPSRIASDGSGGLWISAVAVGTSGNQWYVVHRTKAGAWSRSKIGASDQLFDITSVPDTTSLWGAGGKPATSGTGANTAIWAYGALP